MAQDPALSRFPVFFVGDVFHSGPECHITLVQRERIARASIEAAPGRQAQVVGRTAYWPPVRSMRPLRGTPLQDGYIPVHAGVELEGTYTDGADAE